MSELSVSGCSLFELDVKGDELGSLVAIERATGLPFDIQRAYYIFGTRADQSRGFHAHRDLQQWVICLAGSCTFRLDDGSNVSEFLLDRRDTALQIGSWVWREMHNFSPDCVLLVLASAPYSPTDYIRDYDEFCAEVRHQS